MSIPINSTPAAAVPPSAGGPLKRARNPEEAAAQFEQVLAKQFVQSMTKDLFKSGLDGEEGFGWTDSYGDAQRDVLTDVLTKNLLDKGTFRLSELLLRQWDRAATPEEGVQPANAAAADQQS